MNSVLYFYKLGPSFAHNSLLITISYYAFIEILRKKIDRVRFKIATMSQQSSRRYYPCCRAREGDVVPKTFQHWNAENGAYSSLDGPTHEKATEINIYNYWWTYLFSGNHSSSYYIHFLGFVEKIRNDEIEAFDFVPSSPLLGFFSFKEFAKRTSIWFREFRYADEDLLDYELHLKLRDHYAEGLLSISPDDLEAFSKLRADRVEFIQGKLNVLEWSDLGLCTESHGA